MDGVEGGEHEKNVLFFFLLSQTNKYLHGLERHGMDGMGGKALFVWLMLYLKQEALFFFYLVYLCRFLCSEVFFGGWRGGRRGGESWSDS